MGVVQDSAKRIRDGAVAMAKRGMSAKELAAPEFEFICALDAISVLARFASAVVDLAVFRRVQGLSQAKVMGRPPELYEALRAAHDTVRQWFEALGLPYTDI